MLRIVILLAPVFMCLFWAITLISDHKGYHISRRYLAVYLLVPALNLFCHFLYFAPFPDLYVYFDLPLQTFGMLFFPLYHIYFRLLTVDDKISFKKHIKFHVLPLIITIVYGIAVFNSTFPEYKAWLFNKTTDVSSPSVQFLQIMRNVLRIGFTIQGIYYIAANHLLINKYAERAERFYSDVRDAKTGYAKLLNLSIILSSVITLLLVIIGRAFLMSADGLIFLAWTSLTVTAFFVGSLGSRQKVINPDVEAENNDESLELFAPSVNDQDIMMNKILTEFRENKLYLNNELTLHDVAKIVGSNRTYLSGIINQKFNQNFCAFVNGFRVQELELVMLENPDYILDQYVVLCGFGSVNSMKRSVAACTGMSFHDFKSALRMRKRA
jgi:AraC-like DNA-binding protein